MPHLVIEYSEDVAQQADIDAVVAAAHDGAMDSGLFPEYDIKTRAAAYKYHRTGQTRDSFVHVSVHLLDGRSDEQKSALRDPETRARHRSGLQTDGRFCRRRNQRQAATVDKQQLFQ